MKRFTAFSLMMLGCILQMISCAPKPDNVRVCTQGESELTGRGNRNEVLTKVDVMVEDYGILTGMDIVLEGADAIEAVRVSEGVPYPSGPDCRPSANTKTDGRSVKVRDGRSSYHLPCRIAIEGKATVSICADIRSDAPEGARLSAKVVSATISGIRTAPDMENPSYRETILARRLLYAPGDYSSLAWRIPAILQLSDGTLLAVNDKRNDSEEDLPGRIDIVASYSTDNGMTWSKPEYVVKNKGFMGGYGDPSLAQLPDGTVICMMAGSENFSRSSKGNPQRCYFTTSHDSGRTWSEITELTTTLWGDGNSLPRTADCCSNFFSSGNNLVLKNGEHKGRMLAVGVLRRGEGFENLHNHAVYTDDGGKTWHASEDACPTGDEAKMVELNDGSILMSIRTYGDRLHTISKDGGQTWGPVAGWEDMHVTNCNGDMIRYNDSIILHSIACSMKRENVSILLSFDEGRTWSERKTILAGPGQYSSITVLKDGTIGAYLEKNTWGTELWYLNFSLDWIRNNDSGKTADSGMDGTRLWEGGPVWANRNIGAASPEQTGDFFAWGATRPDLNFGWGRYKFGDQSVLKPYGGEVLASCDDAASANLGEGWRIPTEQDFEDLCNNCNWTWTQSNGKYGYEIKGELGSIFLPAAGYRSGSRYRYHGDLGYYWTANPSPEDATQAREFYFHLNYRKCHDRGRDNGHTIRAVKD